MAIDLPSPDRKSCLQILQDKAKNSQIELSEEVCHYVINNLPPNILTFPITSTGSGATINTPPSRMMASNVIPEILFNENNIHNVHALAMYGVNV